MTSLQLTNRLYAYFVFENFYVFQVAFYVFHGDKKLKTQSNHVALNTRLYYVTWYEFTVCLLFFGSKAAERRNMLFRS